MEFKFAPVSPPSAELVRVYGPDADTDVDFEVIDHLGQLARALANGSIGFEYYTHLLNEELGLVGWAFGPDAF